MMTPSKRLPLTLATALFASALALTGCASGSGAGDASDPADGSSAEHDAHGDHSTHSTHDGHGDTDTGTDADAHAGMDHPMDGGPAPEGMREAADPTYPVGSEVTLTADHMHGMEGATATIVGAYDTFTYAVDFTPTTGGDPVLAHKWVVHEEIEDPGAARLADGAAAKLLAEHMGGMKGAAAKIAFSTDETVYMVDYEADGMKMTNHKWVVESEITPAG